MSEIEKRLVASVKMDALNGNHAERDICGKQMLEAATELSRLKEELEKAYNEISKVGALSYKRGIELARWEEKEVSVCPEDVGFVEYIARLREELAKAKELTEAFDRSPFDISPCRGCGKPVLCLPDGMGGLCEKCEEGYSE